MDFVIGLLKVQSEVNVLQVIVNRLTKIVYFLPIKGTISIDQLEKLYIRENVRLHGMSKMIISDRDTNFMLTFQKSLHRLWGIDLAFSIAYHPYIDSQIDKTNQMLEDMLRAYCLDHRLSWVEILSLVKFTYNNNYQTMIQMVSYEVLYGKRYHSPLHWDKLDERYALVQSLRLELTQKMIDGVQLIR